MCLCIFCYQKLILAIFERGAPHPLPTQNWSNWVFGTKRCSMLCIVLNGLHVVIRTGPYTHGFLIQNSEVDVTSLSFNCYIYRYKIHKCQMYASDIWHYCCCQGFCYELGKICLNSIYPCLYYFNLNIWCWIIWVDEQIYKIN